MNPFANYGEGSGRGRRQKHPTKQAAPTAETTRRQEQAALTKAYHAARAQWFGRALDCPEGPRVRAMLAWIGTLGPGDADELVEVVAGEDWLLAASSVVRFAALQLIGDQIGRIRRQGGLLEFDDPLPGEADTAFFIIRRLLNP